MRFPVVVTLLWMPAAVVAAPESPSTPASHTSAFSGYQAWSEPAVRDWQETHALVMDEPSGHAGHTMGSSPDEGRPGIVRNPRKIRSHNVTDVTAARKQLGMPDRLGSCHTAKVAGYVVEGHVPVADIQRLLKEKPKALGIAVPSMPPGSPGMESPKPVPYNTLLVQTGGETSIFAKH
ncbi:MAG: DUF411 domain-containing protein [Gammaproteobacteria bacterium]